MSIWLHEERIHLSQRRENVRISGARVTLYVKSGCRCRNTHFQANPVQTQEKGSKGVKVAISFGEKQCVRQLAFRSRNTNVCGFGGPVWGPHPLGASDT